MADGAMNQSMDDILAQIRKIISEEPGAAAKPAPAAVAIASPLATRTTLPPAPAVSAPAVPEPMLVPSLEPGPELAAVKASRSPVIDDLSDLLEDDATVPSVPAQIATAALAAAPVAEPTATTNPTADLIADTPPPVPEIQVALAPTTVPEIAIAALATSAPAVTPAVTSIATPAVATSPSPAVLSFEPQTAASPAPSVDPAPPSTPPAAPAAAPPPIAILPAVVAAPVSLSTLFSNRIDANTLARGGLLVPTHIGRATEAKAVEPAPIASITQTDDMPAAPPSVSAPLGGALGALAAGLAASGFAPSSAPPAPPVAETSPPTAEPAAAIEPSAAVSQPDTAQLAPAQLAPALTTDQLMDAIRPVLKDWLDGNLPRILDGALKDALPDLITRAKDQSAKDQTRKP